MIRQALVLLIFVGLSALAGAQGEKPALSASQQQQLFQKNRGMIKTLVDSSLEISQMSGDGVQRTQCYVKVVQQFREELDRAANDADPSRVAELGKHLDTVLRKGLTPSLRDAHVQIGPGGTGVEKLGEIRRDSLILVDWLQTKARDKWPDTPEVREVIDSLEKTKNDLDSIGK
jgi:hypothetical protein